MKCINKIWSYDIPNQWQSQIHQLKKNHPLRYLHREEWYPHPHQRSQLQKVTSPLFPYEQSGGASLNHKWINSKNNWTEYTNLRDWSWSIGNGRSIDSSHQGSDRLSSSLRRALLVYPFSNWFDRNMAWRHNERFPTRLCTPGQGLQGLPRLKDSVMKSRVGKKLWFESKETRLEQKHIWVIAIIKTSWKTYGSISQSSSHAQKGAPLASFTESRVHSGKIKRWLIDDVLLDRGVISSNSGGGHVWDRVKTKLREIDWER